MGEPRGALQKEGQRRGGREGGKTCMQEGFYSGSQEEEEPSKSVLLCNHLSTVVQKLQSVCVCARAVLYKPRAHQRSSESWGKKRKKKNAFCFSGLIHIASDLKPSLSSLSCCCCYYSSTTTTAGYCFHTFCMLL